MAGTLRVPLLYHFQKTVNTSGGFFGDTVDALQHLGVVLVDMGGEIATIIQNHIGVPEAAISIATRLLNTPDVLLFSLPFPSKDRNTRFGDRRCCMVLGWKMLQEDQRTSAPNSQRVSIKTGGLDGHVDTADDLGTCQRFFGTVLGANGHKGRHFTFGDRNSLRPHPAREISATL